MSIFILLCLSIFNGCEIKTTDLERNTAEKNGSLSNNLTLFSLVNFCFKIKKILELGLPQKQQILRETDYIYEKR